MLLLQWDVKTHQKVKISSEHQKAISDLQLSSDRKYLIKSKMKNRWIVLLKNKTYSIIDVVVVFRNDVYLRVKRYDSQVMGYGSIGI